MATPARVARNDGYGKFTRFYEVDGQKLPSVTTILDAVAKPALVPWAARQERNLIYEAVRKLIERPDITRTNFFASLDAAVGQEKAHVKAMNKAKTIGSECHGLIEWHIRRELKQAVGSEPQVSDKALWAFMVYEEWRKAANLSVTLVEQVVYSKRYGYAGTMDFGGEIDHEGQRIVVLGDFKTSKAIWPESHLQVAAYAHALVEMGYATTIPAGCIVRLPKLETDPAPEVLVIPAEKMKHLHKVFLNALELWKWQDSNRERR